MDSTGIALRSLTDSRDTARVGRQARLELVFARRGGRTVVVHAYAEPPFRVGRWFQEGDGVHMILTSSAPGCFGGDRFQQLIVVEQGARVRLTSQSALQVHPSPDQEAAQLHASYQVDADAELACEWDPMIPFTNSRFDQRVSVTLAGTARLFWSDALMAGRVASPSVGGSAWSADDLAREKWAFSELSHDLRVMRGDTLEYLERYRISPAERPVDAVWIADQASYVGTILLTGHNVEATLVAGLHDQLAGVAGVHAAADRLDSHLCLVRLTSESGVAFRHARALTARALALVGSSTSIISNGTFRANV